MVFSHGTYFEFHIELIMLRHIFATHTHFANIRCDILLLLLLLLLIII
jgi:hypothetical protein